MSDTRKITVAQVGVGGFGGERRRRMRATGLFDLVACYDLNEKAMEQCRKQDGARPVGSFEELLAFDGVEALVISSGAKFHAEQIIAAAERGLHVFTEKPLCSTPDEMRAILEAQRERRIVIGVGHTDHSSDPVSMKIKEIIDAGELGRVATVEKTTAHPGGWHIEPGDWRGDPEKNPGGMLFQCGVHAIHELLYYFGPIARVSAMMRYDVHTTQTADVACCILEFASGLVGTLNAYHVTPYRHTMSVFGTKANLYRSDRYYHEGTTLLMQRTHLDNKHEPEVPVDVDGADDPDGRGTLTGMESFHRAVREGGAPYPSVVDGARAVAVVFAAEESARTGCAVEVPAVGEA